MNKELIRKNFSKYARYYDKYSTTQNLCALRLVAKIKTNGLSRILDIGCGTGNYTKLLKNKFPTVKIKALDISPEMIRIAKNKLQDKKTEFIVADGEAINFDEQFDLITSNACFQWFEDLDRTLFKYRKLLKKNGVILFSTFGPLTFHELNSSLKELFKKDKLISSCNFFQKNELSSILEKYFKGTIIEEEVLKEEYNSISELLNKIRYTGARGDSVNGRNLWTIELLNELQKVYKKKFKYLIATYQIFYCWATR
jgi:malonyl-CoA O-methyltransferase